MFNAQNGYISSEDGTPLVLFHLTSVAFGELDPSRTSDGGLHFGPLDQGMMRTAGAGMARRTISAHIKMTHPARSRDQGGNWKEKIRRAKAAGKDGIVYLNRYEGMTTAIIERLSKSGHLNGLDDLSDAAFRRLVPEAQDSYIVFSADQLELLSSENQSNAPQRPKISG
jgi:hypothetical protein